MNLKSNIYETTVDTIGSIYGIAYIKEVLGIIVLVFTIVNILFKAGIVIHNKIKQNKVEEIPQVIDNTIEQLNDIKENANEDKRHL